MGYFADIIRDSRRGGMAPRAPGAFLSRGNEEVPTGAPAAGSELSVIRLREEGGGQPVTAGQVPLQSGTVTRQVVGPSPSEQTPVAGIPEAMVKGVILPNPVAREQAGCESARTVAGEFRVEQMGSFHGNGSLDVPLVSVGASDSCVRESSSGDAASEVGKVSVETQGRRQAGVTRAGSTTPPDQLAGEPSGHKVMARADDPAGSTVPERAAEQVASGYLPAEAEEIPVPSIPRHPPPPASPAEQTSRPGGLPEETPRSVVTPVRGSFAADDVRHEPLPDVMPAVATVSSAPVPAGGERFHRATQRPLPALPRGGDAREQGRSLPPPEPRVRIGTIEVVVVTPAPAERSPRSEERSRPDLASRHYLRNF